MRAVGRDFGSEFSIHAQAVGASETIADWANGETE
jgi:hypothetical protein